jgi:succinyl-diaminopimelate desuccinylase
VPLTDRERQQFAALPFSEEEFFAEVGVQAAFGEEGYSALERRWARPTFDVCGLWGGYQGEGSKTVLPAKAGAKFSFRLVPHQSPEKITAALRRWLPEITPPGVTVELIGFHGAPGVMMPLESRYIAAAARAIEHAFGRAPVYTREGGSIPIVTKFHEALGADVLLLGWGTDDDNAHSPNEKFSLADFHRGIKASARLWAEIGKLASV